MRGPRLGTTIRLAITGSTSDRLRIILSALGSALATGFVLAATNVLLIDIISLPGSSRSGGGYTKELLDQPGLHPGLVVALLALSLPLFAFVGQCIRVGAPARDRRLAAFRMAGATGPEVGRIVVIETALAAGAGALAGAALFAYARSLMASEADVAGQLPWPTDVAMPLAVYLVVVVAVIALASLGTLLALRRTIVDPFGVRHRHVVVVPALPALLVPGLALFVLSQAVFLIFDGGSTGIVAASIIAVAGVSLIGIGFGVVLATAALAQRVGRFVRLRTERADLLLAAARLEASPFRSSRSLAAVLAAVLVGSTVQTIRTAFLAGASSNDAFYVDTFNLLNYALAAAVLFGVAGLFVAAAEGITERRRTLAALVAAGTPRTVIVRSVLAETVLPLIPGTVACAIVGTLLGGVYGGALGGGGGPALSTLTNTALLCAGSIVAALAVTSVSLVFLSSSTSPTELRAAA